MGILRKSFIHVLVLSLILGSTAVYADDIEPGGVSAAAPPKKGATTTEKLEGAKKTPFAAFQSDSFCAKAPAMLENLNNENSRKIAAIDDLNGEIQSEKSYMDIINGIDALTKKYQEGLNKIAQATSPQTIAAQQADKFETLDNMKKVIRNGLIINAVGLLFKEKNLENDDAFKASTLCPRTNAAPICTESYFNAFNPLTPILENFRIAYRNIKGQNKANLQADVERIIASIPDSIAPSKILAMLETSSPGLTAILASNEISKADLTLCLTEKSSAATKSACEKFLPDGKKTTNLMQELNSQTNAAVSEIKGLSEIINESARANLAKFNHEIVTYSQQSQTVDIRAAQAIAQLRRDYQSTNRDVENKDLKQQAQKAIAAKSGDRSHAPLRSSEVDREKLTPMQKIFLPSARSDQMREESNTDIREAIARNRFWEENCVKPENIDVLKCQQEMNKISQKVNELKTNYKTKLENIEVRLAAVSDSSYKNIETIKRFVFEKYRRTCETSSNIKMKREEVRLDIAVDGKCFQGVQTLYTIEGLSSGMNDVVAKMKFAQSSTGQKDTTGTFSKEEMNEFSSACQAINSANKHKDACNEVSGEKVARDKVLDSKEWETFNDKYWVSYDDKSPKGYSVAKRKSNLRVFGEGVLPVAPQMLPMVFGNYIMRQNINTLTNQGLYQKQMLHNYDVYNSNPWMYNYNLFGGPTVYPAYSNTGVTSTTGFGF